MQALAYYASWRTGWGGVAAGVEHVGSSSVEGLLAKPIVDVVIGLTTDQELTPVRERLEFAGWIY